MDSKLKSKTQMRAAARSEVSISTAHRIEKGEVTGERKERNWKTRQDPFEKVWKSSIQPRLESRPNLLPITLLEKLQEDFPGEYPDKLLRTLQRKVKQWKLLHGPKKEVIFNQEHFPGRMGISDFTKLKKITITVRGREFRHLLYHFRLAYSGWSFLKVVQGGESYTALTEGLQEALWRLGGAPKEHRTDSLSAAFKNLKEEIVADLTRSYEEFCAHYKMVPTRNNRGMSHENGSVESPHGHIKRRIAQALLLRESSDFTDLKSYQEWLENVVSSHNRRNARELDFERQSLQKLPRYKTTDFTESIVRVHSSSTVEIKKILYSVPSRLRGETLRAHVYQDRIELYCGSEKAFNLERVYSSKERDRKRLINYRHLIHSLHKKPQAFRYSQLREAILPNEKFRSIWQSVDSTMQPRAACKFIVGLLYLADKYDCEEDIADYVNRLIHKKQNLTLACIEQRYRKSAALIPDISIQQHSLQDYNIT